MNDTKGTTHGRTKLTTSFVLFMAGVSCVAISLIWGIDDNIPSILLLLVGSCSVLFAVLRNFGSKKALKPGLQLLFWSPRVICIVFSLFTVLFSFDVFGQGKGFWETALALLIHNVPLFAMVIILAVTWRWEWFGGILFSLLGFAYIALQWRRFPLSNYVVMAGPLFVTGTLFLLNWKYRRAIKGATFEKEAP